MSEELDRRIEVLLEATERLNAQLAVVVRVLEQAGVEFNRNENGEIIGLAYSVGTTMQGRGGVNVGR